MLGWDSGTIALSFQWSEEVFSPVLASTLPIQKFAAIWIIFFLIGKISSLPKLSTACSSPKFDNDVFWINLGDFVLMGVLF